MQDYFHPQMTQQELLAMSSLALAHIGDAVFELLVRTKLCVEGGATPILTASRSTPRRANIPAQRGWRPCLARCISPGRPRASRRCLPP